MPNTTQRAKVEQTDEPWELPGDAVVVLGAFNPDILSPQWVKKHVFPESTERPASQYRLSSSGVGAFIHKIGDVFWEPTRQHVRFIGAPNTTGKFAQRVLMTLSHTPVSAAGINFTRSITSDRKQFGPFRLDAPPRDVAKLIPDGTLMRHSMTLQVNVADGVQLNLKMDRAEGSETIGLDFNFHLDASGESAATALANHCARAPELQQTADSITRALSNG